MRRRAPSATETPLSSRSVAKIGRVHTSHRHVGDHQRPFPGLQLGHQQPLSGTMRTRHPSESRIWRKAPWPCTSSSRTRMRTSRACWTGLGSRAHYRSIEPGRLNGDQILVLGANPATGLGAGLAFGRPAPSAQFGSPLLRLWILLTYRELGAREVTFGLGSVPEDAPDAQGWTWTSIGEEDLDAVARPFGLRCEGVGRTEKRAALGTNLEEENDPAPVPAFGSVGVPGGGLSISAETARTSGLIGLMRIRLEGETTNWPTPKRSSLVTVCWTRPSSPIQYRPA